MKLKNALCLGVALLIPELALAKLPFSNELFGRVEGTLDFCTQVDAPEAEKYQEKKKIIVKDLPDNEVAEARTTAEYKTAYQSTREEAVKAPRGEAVKSCSAALESKN